MFTSQVKYIGNLQTECVHLKSNTKIVTDAPTDNNGKGSAFSPTDLLATSLASCMFTIMGIYCNEHKIPFKMAEAKVLKIMDSNPRRVSKIELIIDLTGNQWDEKTKEKVKKAGMFCPVAKTIENVVEIEYKFI
ncbi:MAG: OsmC family protein [Flavobacteriia bacterium]|nr:OsmC family protein [Flavobacteriia bacterium]